MAKVKTIDKMLDTAAYPSSHGEQNRSEQLLEHFK